MSQTVLHLIFVVALLTIYALILFLVVNWLEYRHRADFAKAN